MSHEIKGKNLANTQLWNLRTSFQTSGVRDHILQGDFLELRGPGYIIRTQDDGDDVINSHSSSIR